jgi:hypothetical protein
MALHNSDVRRDAVLAVLTGRTVFARRSHRSASRGSPSSRAEENRRRRPAMGSRDDFAVSP